MGLQEIILSAGTMTTGCREHTAAAVAGTGKKLQLEESGLVEVLQCHPCMGLEILGSGKQVQQPKKSKIIPPGILSACESH